MNNLKRRTQTKYIAIMCVLFIAILTAMLYNVGETCEQMKHFTGCNDETYYD